MADLFSLHSGCMCLDKLCLYVKKKNVCVFKYVLNMYSRLRHSSECVVELLSGKKASYYLTDRFSGKKT